MIKVFVFIFWFFIRISRGEQSTIICDIVAATNVGNLVGFSAWQCINGNPTTNICNWLGIICLSANTPLSIHISKQGLIGSLPSSVGGLTNLLSLDLSFNSLKKTIPSTIGSMKSLVRLLLNSNALTGSIPTGLCLLNSLTIPDQTVNGFIDLSRNKLVGEIPPILILLKSLKHLDLSRNSIGSSVPSNIDMLLDLTYLDLSVNGLYSSIPQSIGRLHSLAYLNLSKNSLKSSIPSDLCGLRKIKSLNLAANSITSTIPSCLSSLQDLEYLNMSSNLLGATISKSLLLPVNVNSSALTLKYLDLSSNSFTGSLPSTLTFYTNLVYLSLRLNRLHGLPSQALCALPSLSFLELGFNQLSCLLPCQTDADVWTPSYPIHRCPDAQDQALYDLDSSLGIINSLDQKSAMTSVIIQDTVAVRYFNYPKAFEYSISFFPESTFFESNPPFYYLFCEDIACNIIIDKADGVHGDTFTISRSSFYLMAVNSDNYWVHWFYKFYLAVFSYSVPSWGFEPLQPRSLALNVSYSAHVALRLCQSPWVGVTCKYGYVTELSLKGFGLRGTVPDSIGGLLALTTLDISSNQISGSLTRSIGRLRELKKLTMSYNHFTGTVPDDLRNITYLAELTIAYNKFNGPVPDCISNLVALRLIYLDGNSFLGEVTSGLCKSLSSNNATLSLTSNPYLACYQDECRGGAAAFVPPKFDSTLMKCKPTAMPTSMPTVSPSMRPFVETLVVANYNTLNTTEIAGILLFVLVVSLIVAYIRCCSPGALRRKQLTESLRHLHVHRTLLTASSIEPTEVLLIVQHNLECAKLKDLQGRTALDIVFDREHKIAITPEIVYLLLIDAMEMNSHPTPTVDQNASISVTNGSASPNLTVNPAWIRAVQCNDDVVVGAVQMVLRAHKGKARLLADVRDATGRSCRHIAGSRCKDIILRATYLNERYELQEGPPIHRSGSTTVVRATDHNLKKPVVLKFMAQRYQFDNEIGTRAEADADERYVVPLLCKYDGSSADPTDVQFREDAVLRNFTDFPYCIVLEAASSNLRHVIDHANIVGDYEEIRRTIRQLTHCLKSLHDKNIVHCDLTTRHVMMCASALKLIDFDCSINLSDSEVSRFYRGHKYSSAYLPPELLFFSPSSGEVAVRGTSNISHTEGSYSGYGLIEANPALDMWALGCITYLICTGSTLFLCSIDDCISNQEDMLVLLGWNESVRQRKLEVISNKYARHLCSLLLHRDPKKRINADRVLSHPFLTGRSALRLAGERPLWHVFLSYRFDSDFAVAEKLYNALTQRGIHVWWDRMLAPGKLWEEEVSKGLVGAASFVNIVSRKALRSDTSPWQNIENMHSNSRCDSLLLEYRLALELKERDLLQGIFPVMIGDEQPDGTFSNYFRSGCHPDAASDVVVEALESKVKFLLDGEGLGSPYLDAMSVKSLVDTVLSNQGGFVEGDFQGALENVVSAIGRMCFSILEVASGGKAVSSELESEGIGSDGGLVELDSMIRRQSQLLAQNKSLMADLEKRSFVTM